MNQARAQTESTEVSCSALYQQFDFLNVKMCLESNKAAADPLDSFLDYVYSEVKSLPENRRQLFMKSTFDLVQKLKNNPDAS